MLGDGDETNASWIGFADLFFHLFVFFLIVFTLFKISSANEIENSNTEIDNLNQQLKIYHENLDKCQKEKKNLIEERDFYRQEFKQCSIKKGNCERRVADCAYVEQELMQCRADIGKFKVEREALYKKIELCGLDGEGDIRIKQIQDSQKKLIEQIEEQYRIEINVKTDIHIQTISFGSGILFNSGEAVLSENGKAILTATGKVFLRNLKMIKELQIQGHTDNDPILQGSKYNSNLELAAIRAINVFKHFKDEVGINPIEILMSATSFGKYKPVERQQSEEFTEEKLGLANLYPDEKAKNRRIEIVLIYKHDSK